jgi:hypothetical protein
MDALMAKTLMQPEQNSEKKRSTHTVLCYWYISGRIKQNELMQAKGGNWIPKHEFKLKHMCHEIFEKNG